jgi:periodic tryptophan protein 2
LLLAIDEIGHAAIINWKAKIVLANVSFQGKVLHAQFSKDSQFLAVSHIRTVQIWKCPALVTQFRPLTLIRTITGHYDLVTHIDWSHDSR